MAAEKPMEKVPEIVTWPAKSEIWWNLCGCSIGRATWSTSGKTRAVHPPDWCQVSKFCGPFNWWSWYTNKKMGMCWMWVICDSQVDAHHVVKTVVFSADVTMFDGFTQQQTRQGGGPHLVWMIFNFLVVGTRGRLRRHRSLLRNLDRTSGCAKG